MSDPGLPDPAPKRRLPFDENAFSRGKSVERGMLFIYVIIAGGLAALAAYMAIVERHPMMSPYVVAPAVGAAWFALRVFMKLAPRV